MKEDWKIIDETYELNSDGFVRTRKMKKFRTRYYYTHGGLAVFLENNVKTWVVDLISKYFYPVTEEITNLNEFLQSRQLNSDNSIKDSIFNPLITEQQEIQASCVLLAKYYEDIMKEPIPEKFDAAICNSFRQAEKLIEEFKDARDSKTPIEPIAVYKKKLATPENV